VLSSVAEAQSRFKTRQPLYIRLARLTVPTAELTPALAAKHILEHLAARTI